MTNPHSRALHAMNYPEPTEQDKKDQGMKPYCPCQSGEYREEIYDARGIFVAFVCDKCRNDRLNGYRADIFTDSNYPATEPIEPEDY